MASAERGLKLSPTETDSQSDELYGTFGKRAAISVTATCILSEQGMKLWARTLLSVSKMMHHPVGMNLRLLHAQHMSD